MSAVCASACHRPSIHHLRPSATVAAWHPGPAAPVRGKASIPPVFVSTGSGASFRRDLPGFVCAQRSSMPGERRHQMFLPIYRRQPALASVLHFIRTWICYARCLRFRLPPAEHSPSPIRITPLLFANPKNCKEKQPPHPKRRAAVAAEGRSNLCYSVERPAVGSVKKIIAVAPAALVVRQGSSSSRRQPALASVLHFIRTWICYARCLRFRLPPAKHSPSPIRITPLSFANPTKCKKKQPPHPNRRAAVAAVAAPPTIVPKSPPSHQR
jgi:hypothetical protein